MISNCSKLSYMIFDAGLGDMGQLFLAIRQSSQWDSLRLWDRDSFN